MIAPPSTQRTALITGASAGIGRELSRLFAQDGYQLVLVARSQARLLELAAQLRSEHGISATVVAKDLSVPDGPREVFAELQERSIQVDILVNDAGRATHGLFAEADLDEQYSLLQLDVVSPAQLTRLFLPHMIERRFGRILNVASMASFVPGPLTATYNASKAFVLSFSAALANELEGTGVTVTALCPGPTRTLFSEQAGLTHTRAFSRRKTMDAATVARIGYRALMKGKLVKIAGMWNRVQLFPTPLVPLRILAHFSRKYHEDLPAHAGPANR